MEVDGEVLLEPVSPTGQCFNSSAMSISVLAVLESEIPIDDSQTMSLIRNVLLPVNPLFSSVMVKEINGERKWKKVQVNLEDHVVIPSFPSSLSLEMYDAYFNEYMTKLVLEQLPQAKPLWEIHMLKYPTSNTAGNVIFKLHHSLGDGYSLMSVLLSCLRRADDSSLPLTFPSKKRLEQSDFTDNIKRDSIWSRVSQFFFATFNNILDFGWSVSKSTIVEDDLTPIRSSGDCVEFRPITIWTMAFSLHHIKQIKSKLRAMINDVLCGMIFYDIQLYMHKMDPKSIQSNSILLMMLNTREFGSYKSVQDVLKPNSDAPWGNRVAFLHITIPKVTDSQLSNPLEFITEAQKLIMKKKKSFAVFLTAKLLETLTKLRGPEGGARYLTLRNSGTGISNMIGPVEKMSLGNHPVKGLYFTVAGIPQSLMITVMSYMGDLRIAFGSEKEFIDQQKFKSCMEKAFDKMQKAAFEVSI